MPTRKRFTPTWLKSLVAAPPIKDTTYSEGGRVGFMLRHRQGGALVWLARYQRDGKPVWLTLGEYPAMTLEEAHEAHSEVRKQLASGLDPKAERERLRMERERQEERRKAVDAVTVRNVIAEWAWHYARRNRKRPREAVRLLKGYVAEAKHLKGKPATEIRKRDIVLVLDRITARGSRVMANRIDALGRQVFAFAVARDLLETSPWVGISRPGGDEQPKERKLTDDEIRGFWEGVEDAAISKPVRLALKLILVTAQRPGEIAGAALTEFNGAVWTIPPERSKNGKAHIVPLSPLALDLIEQLKAATAPKKDRPRSPFLLPSVHVTLKPDEPLSVRALSRALRNCHDDGEQLFGFEPFTPHDLRRTAASHMTALGIDRLHVSKVLNHTDDGVTGKVYDQHDYLPEKTRALTVWADHVGAVVAGKQKKVVPIKRAAR